MIIPAVLGWSNIETEGGDRPRLYANDVPNPRWDHTFGRGGRTIERKLIHGLPTFYEGDRFLVVSTGNRFVIKDYEDQLIAAIKDLTDNYAAGMLAP